MTFEKCSIKTKVKNVKLEEKNAKVVFKNDLKIEHIKTQFDGCVVKNATAADFVLTKSKIGQIIIELKGTDVAHAADQIIKTARYLSDNGLRVGKLGGLIIGRRWPRFDTALQRKQASFVAEFKSPMKLETFGIGLVFEKYLDF